MLQCCCCYYINITGLFPWFIWSGPWGGMFPGTWRRRRQRHLWHYRMWKQQGRKITAFSVNRRRRGKRQTVYKQEGKEKWGGEIKCHISLIAVASERALNCNVMKRQWQKVKESRGRLSRKKEKERKEKRKKERKKGRRIFLLRGISIWSEKRRDERQRNSSLIEREQGSSSLDVLTPFSFL